MFRPAVRIISAAALIVLLVVGFSLLALGSMVVLWGAAHEEQLFFIGGIAFLLAGLVCLLWCGR